MRVAYDYQIFSSQKYGGISRYFFELSDRIANQSDIDVRVICPFYTNAYIGSCSKNLHVSGKKMPSIRWTGCVRGITNRLFSQLMMANFKPDLVHETYYLQNSVAPFASKVVLTVYDMIHERFPEYFTTKSLTTKKAAAIKRADHIISISHNTKKDICNFFGIEEKKITVVHLGFSGFKSTHTINDRKFESIESRPFLLYVGNRSEYKNFELFVRAVSESDNLMKEFDIIAFGGGNFKRNEIQLMSQLGYKQDQVRLATGSDIYLGYLYQNAAAFIYPSLYEGFGLPPLEAMVNNCPVVASNTSSMPEVIGDAAEFFDPKSTEQIRHAIEKVVFSSERTKQLINLGRERLKQFSWEKCAAETLNVYKSILSS
ncbi:MAG: glycosyltransferase family 1 protein [Candidatus Electrothrix sp. AW2]|nr:glycosyltransferase family 1 protein [Candidatus Electrothrix gigas]